jgi:hypothetical protein
MIHHVTPCWDALHYITQQAAPGCGGLCPPIAASDRPDRPAHAGKSKQQKLCTFEIGIICVWQRIDSDSFQRSALSIQPKTTNPANVFGSWGKVVQDTADPDSCAAWMFQAVAVAAD